MSTAIVLFYDDFRIIDNPALYYACQEYKKIIPLYIYKKDYLGRDLGSAASVFLHHTLYAFKSLLVNQYGVHLVIKSGNYTDVIDDIIKEYNIDAIYFNESYSRSQVENEISIKKRYTDINVKSFTGKVLLHPSLIKNKSGDNFKVFTPFSKECMANEVKIGSILPKPSKILSQYNVKSLDINDLNLLPKNQGNWHKDMISFWSFDYDDIEKKFLNFVDNEMEGYSSARNIPSLNGTSKISPYLRFGIIGSRWCYKIASFRYNIDSGDLFDGSSSKNGNIAFSRDNQFILELLWREFAYHCSFYIDNIDKKEIKDEYSLFSWDNNDDFFKKWKLSKTGFDIVDAGMSQIWKTGYMHNRVRMIVASFLIKDLMIDWKIGEKYFWDTLVDADYAINPFSWQWVFGSGFDASPYFRVFNPDLQAEKFDPNFEYRKKWLDTDKLEKRCVSHDIQKNLAISKYKKILQSK